MTGTQGPGLRQPRLSGFGSEFSGFRTDLEGHEDAIFAQVQEVVQPAVRVHHLGVWILGVGFLGFRFGVKNLEFGVSGFGFAVVRFGFGVWAFLFGREFGVWGWEIWV